MKAILFETYGSPDVHELREAAKPRYSRKMAKLISTSKFGTAVAVGQAP
jgi:hypothetical protein